MQVASLLRWLLFAAACVAWFPTLVSSVAFADEKIALYHAGLIKLTSYVKHIKYLRGMKRYEPRDLDRLIQLRRKGGPEFFSSQIIVQEEQSGSGTFDLRVLHGLEDAIDYRNVTAWACRADDYPIVYFVGFRVRKIDNDTIFVSREKDIVNVISLRALDAKLEKHIKVQMFEGNKVLCRDIAAECDQNIFYDRE